MKRLSLLLTAETAITTNRAVTGSVTTAMAFATAGLSQHRDHFASIVLYANAVIYKTCLIVFLLSFCLLFVPLSSLPIPIFITFICYSFICFPCSHICTSDCTFFHGRPWTLVWFVQHKRTQQHRLCACIFACVLLVECVCACFWAA